MVLSLGLRISAVHLLIYECLFQLLVNAIFPTLKWLEARIIFKREYIL